MKTTEVFVEILIIGFGPVVAAIVGVHSLSAATFVGIFKLHPSIVIVVGSIVCFIFGVVIDRISDSLLSNYEMGLRQSVLRSAGETVSFQELRSRVYVAVPHIREWAEYGRVRLRVCRGWVVNIVLIVVVYSSALVVKGESVLWNFNYFAVFVALFVIWIGCVFSWRQLTLSECKRITEEASRLVE